MSSVFSKNSIMSGCVDYFCLACETQLRSDEDAFMHIAKPIHKKNLDGTSFLDKYKEDRVRKVKKGYYCEYCNLFMRTAAKVGPHVAEGKHQENRSSRPLRREGNGVIAFDNVLISENAWHGLIEDTCAVCDAEFDNAQIHKTDTWHALNLVLIDVEVGPDSNVYRKVDESTFQCLTCNLVCALNTMVAHFEEAEHKKLYELCCASAKTKINGKQATLEPVKTPEAVKEDKQRKSPEKETKNAVKEEKQKKNESGEKAAKKELAKEDKPRQSPEQKSSMDKAKESAKETSTKPKETDNKEDKKSKGAKDALGKTDKDICKALGAVDYVARDACGKQWCILCDWAMDDSAVGAHINSRHHLTMLKLHEERSEKRNQANGEPETNDEDSNENKSRILDSANEFQKNDIKLDLVGGSAYCRKCSKSIDFQFDVIKTHIDEHKKKQEAKETKPEPKEVKAFPTGSEQKTSTTLYTAPVHKNDPKPKQEKERESRASSAASNREEAEIESFAKQHNLTYTKDKNNAFCRLCVSKIPASMKNMREHINGMSHKSKVAKTTVKSTVKYPTVTPSHIFIDSVITIENMFAKDIVINEKYVVNILSFLMITKNGVKLRCQACEMNLVVSQIDAHKKTPRHERTMNDALVASSEESEFIREIRQNLFHCGYCNQLEATWTTMEAHLKSTAHREAKTAASWRMMEYAPMIAQHKARQRMEFALFTRLIMGEMFGDD